MKALVITLEQPNRDPRIACSLEKLAQEYQTSLLVAQYAENADKIETYKKYPYIQGRKFSTLIAAYLLAKFLALHALQIIYHPVIAFKIFKAIFARSSLKDFKNSLFKRDLTKFNPIPTAILYMLLREKLPLKEKYDVIWCHEYISAFAGYVYKLHYPNAKIIWDEHEAGVFPDLIDLYKIINPKIDIFISLNEPILAYQQKLLKHPNAFILPNAPLKKPHSKALPIKERLEFVIVGTLNIHMNLVLDSLIEAFSQFPEQAVLHLYLMRPIGTSEKNRDISGLEFQNHAPNIIFHSPLLNQEMLEKIKEYDVGICPYIFTNNYIGENSCANKAGEYMHSGLAVMINQSMSWYGKKIIDFGCGFTYDGQSKDSLHQAINNLLKNPGKVQEMKENSAKAAADFWNYDAFFDKLPLKKIPLDF